MTTTRSGFGLIVVGALFWLALLGGLGLLLRPCAVGGKVAHRVSDHVVVGPVAYRATFPRSITAKPKNAVMIEHDDGSLVPAGRVVAVTRRDADTLVELEVFPDFDHLVTDDVGLTFHRTSGDVGWVVKTLLPPAKMAKIREMAEAAWMRERTHLWSGLRPGLVALVDEAVWILKDDLPHLLEAHDKQIKALGATVKTRLWQKHLANTVRDEVWPDIVERAQPIVERIGDAILADAPVWDLSVAYVTGRLPFGDSNAVSKKVKTFLEEKAVPIIRRHESEIREVAIEVLEATVTNEKVLAEFEKGLTELGRDPTFRRAISDLLRAWVIDNERIVELLKGIANRREIRRPIDRFLERVDWDIQKMANMVVLNDTGDGINPDLARILRRKLLRADESWILLEGGTGGAFDDDVIDGRDGGVR